LAFETQLLGVAVFEYTSPLGYNILAGQIAAALHNVALHREILHKTMLHERDALERMATAKRLQALSVLAGGVAHDLNNSLGPLVALPDVILAELQQLQLTDPAVQDVCADLETIRAASLRAAQTVKDLLTLGRQGRVAKAPVDLNRVVQACLGPGQLRFLQGGHLETEIAVELGAGSIVVQGAEAQLARAVTNLVHNALEALDGSGRVLVRTSRRHVSETLLGYETVDPGDYAVITVSDDGKGIPGAELGRVFEPFFSKKRTGDRSGTGLGLAIVHGVAKEHDGYVDVTSTLGRGTTFTLYIPLAGEPARASWRVLSLRPGNARILVVDDEPIQLRTARRILTRLGYQVDTVSSGREAIELIGLTGASRPSAYDLVILDMLLNEDLDGLEVYELIRERFADQKGIVVSGNAPTERLERAIRSGLVWLAKPYTSDALAGAVQTALGQECAARS
jgi:signal transduction histidine kinase/CheY-like chemotaxis protein